MNADEPRESFDELQMPVMWKKDDLPPRQRGPMFERGQENMYKVTATQGALQVSKLIAALKVQKAVRSWLRFLALRR